MEGDYAHLAQICQLIRRAFLAQICGLAMCVAYLCGLFKILQRKSLDFKIIVAQITYPQKFGCISAPGSAYLPLLSRFECWLGPDCVESAMSLSLYLTIIRLVTSCII